MKYCILVVFIVISAPLLLSCGAKGDLYLPGPVKEGLENKAK